MPTWTVMADRRHADHQHLLRDLRALLEGVDGLTLKVVSSSTFTAFPASPGLRDFAPILYLSHDKLEALDIVATELICEMGWIIDLRRDERPSS